MFKAEFRSHDYHELLSLVEDQDEFRNPDLWECISLDMWDCGCRYGWITGTLTVLMTGGIVCVAHKIHKDIKNRKNEEES